MLSPGAFAHEIRPAIVDLQLHEHNAFKLSVQFNMEAMIAGIGPNHKDTSESPNSRRYNALRSMPAADLEREFRSYLPRFLNDLHLKSDRGRLNVELDVVQIPPVGELALARYSTVVLGGELPPGVRTVSWGWAAAYGPNALRVSDDDRQDFYTVYLKPGETSESIALADSHSQAGWQILSNYLTVGYQHILPQGPDHVLFVVSLFLLSLEIAPLLWQITSFTVAHSITLGLGMLGYMEVSPAIIEPLIALSIVYVCVENILSDKLHAWRPALVFMFGLLHGLGFASVLREIGLNNGHFLLGLLGFNVGVELGQFTVIVLCFLLIGAGFRNKPWYRARVTSPLSAMIGLIGAYWFIERIAL